MLLIQVIKKSNLEQKIMLYRTYGVTLIGIEVVKVTIEVSVGNGVGIYLVGLPDSAVKESLLRVTTAIQRYSYRVPGKKVVINMAPADIKKEGSVFDVAIAVGLLAASEQIPNFNSDEFLIMGELSLDGLLRPVKGALPVAINAASLGFKSCIFPYESAGEARNVEGVNIYGASTFREVVDILIGADYTEELKFHPETFKSIKSDFKNNFSNVKGQVFAKRGLEISAAGGHNILLSGPPGSGKSFMASCIPSILPPMTKEESLETSVIYSVAGKSEISSGLMRQRPFRTPHHTSSIVSLVGGGPKAMPGEISLAHNGVLYLDEMPQYGSSTLDVLRQPLEDREISISRCRYKVSYPASFMLVGSMNPCPCGYAGEDDGRCICTEGVIQRYLSKISGPLMDRMDLFVRVHPVPSNLLLSDAYDESSEVIAERVAKARDIQSNRFKRDKTGYVCHTNAQMTSKYLSLFCKLDNDSKRLMDNIVNKYSLSARSYSRLLKVARTIADLSGDKNILSIHILEAVQYRFF